jgi:hypothetical protein
MTLQDLKNYSLPYTNKDLEYFHDRTIQLYKNLNYPLSWIIEMEIKSVIKLCIMFYDSEDREYDGITIISKRKELRYFFKEHLEIVKNKFKEIQGKFIGEDH